MMMKTIQTVCIPGRDMNDPHNYAYDLSSCENK